MDTKPNHFIIAALAGLAIGVVASYALFSDIREKSLHNNHSGNLANITSKNTWRLIPYGTAIRDKGEEFGICKICGLQTHTAYIRDNLTHVFLLDSNAIYYKTGILSATFLPTEAYTNKFK